MTILVDIPYRWYNVSYNIQLSENNIIIDVVPFGSLTDEFVEYKMCTANMSFLFHIKLISNNVILNVKPILQYNSELELKDDSKEGYIIFSYYNLLTEDIADISKLISMVLWAFQLVSVVF